MYKKDDLKQLNLLYIEDDPIQRETLSPILEMLVKKLFIAKDGLEGLEIFKKQNIQVILTDYEMPNLNGHQIAKEIRNISSKIPIIILSAHSEKKMLMNAIEVQALEYIEKPLDEMKIIESLHSAYLKLEENNLIEMRINDSLDYSFVDQQLYLHNLPVALSKRENRMLLLLLQNRSTLVLKDHFSSYVFDDQIVSDNVIRNTIYKLKKKIGDGIIETIPDIGYMIR